jgi:murein DD-endopeptidase MepM/ murein hydrolase activator NlpD
MLRVVDDRTMTVSSAHGTDAGSPRHRRAGPRSRAAAAATAVGFAILVAMFTAVPSISPATARGFAAGVDGAGESSVSGESRVLWRWPVPPPIRVVSPFRAPPTPYAAGHRGIDLQAEVGATVVAPADGVVSFAGGVAGRGVVSIDHGAGVVSAIEPVDGMVAAGMAVAAGDAIGTVSAGGHCEARCVHFGVRVHGEYVSPFLFLGGLPRAVLLPMS